jgi:Tfp pilus assembly protein PilV
MSRVADRRASGPNTPSTRRDRAAGFAAIDAMIALSILASTVVLSSMALQTAQRAAAAAAETRQATAQLQYWLDTAPRVIGDSAGRAAGFDWSFSTRPVRVGPSAAQLCFRSARARSLRSGRVYALSTAELCPAA